ncbi:MAG: DUF1801 domain-containing protein [Pseudomonadota bacterium]
MPETLFRVAAPLRHDPAIDAWLDAQEPELGAQARLWFTQMRRCGADVRELMHDGCPVACVGDAAFGYVNVFAMHLNVGFFRGALLDDPAGLLEGSGKRMRHVKVHRGVEPDHVALGQLIEDAHADIRRGIATGSS